MRRGCQEVGAGVCLGPRTVRWLAGYSPENGCLSYDCSAVAKNTCNSEDACTGGKCVCRAGSVLLNGNCFTPYSAAVVAGCITIGCGNGNDCLGLGMCTADISGREAACACNVDQAGHGTDKNVGGPMCEGCMAGYAPHEGRCSVSKSFECNGGDCTYQENSD